MASRVPSRVPSRARLPARTIDLTRGPRSLGWLVDSAADGAGSLDRSLDRRRRSPRPRCPRLSHARPSPERRRRRRARPAPRRPPRPDPARVDDRGAVGRAIVLAGPGGDVVGVLAQHHQPRHPPLGDVAAQGPMLGRRRSRRAPACRPARPRTSRPRPSGRCSARVSDGGPHRLGVGVVRVVDDQAAAGSPPHLHPPAGSRPGPTEGRRRLCSSDSPRARGRRERPPRRWPPGAGRRPAACTSTCWIRLPTAVQPEAAAALGSESMSLAHRASSAARSAGGPSGDAEAATGAAGPGPHRPRREGRRR